MKPHARDNPFLDDALPRFDPDSGDLALPPRGLVRTLAQACGMDSPRMLPDAAPIPSSGYALVVDAEGRLFAAVRGKTADGVPVALCLKDRKQMRTLGAWLLALGSGEDAPVEEVRQ